MKANEDHIDLFDRYFNGELSTRERLHLDETLKTDPELRAAFNEYRDMVLGIEAVTPRILKAEFSAIDSQIKSEDLRDYTPQRTGKNRSRKERNWNILMWFMIIGSGLLLVAFLIAIFNLPDLEEKLKKDKKRGDIETVITEEVEESNCTMIACLPPSMFEDYQGKMMIENDDTTYGDYGSQTFMVCPMTNGNEPSIEMLLSSSGDTIKLWNLPCNEIQLYFTPYNEAGVLLECDSMLYHVTEEGFSAYQPQNNSGMADTIEYKDDTEDFLEADATDENNVGSSNKSGVEQKEQITTEAEFGQDIYQWLYSKMRVPESAKTKQVSGKVVASFTVNDKGMVVNPVIVKSLEPDFDAEVLRCIKLMPKWSPATVNGTPTSQSMTLPVKFTAPE